MDFLCVFCFLQTPPSAGIIMTINMKEEVINVVGLLNGILATSWPTR